MADRAAGWIQFETSLPQLWQTRVAQTPQREAYRSFDPVQRAWISYTWVEMDERVRQWRRALHREELTSGARIGVLLPNGVEHVCADQAALSLGLVPVPLHVTDNAENLAYILADSGVSLLFADSLERWQTLGAYQARLPDLTRVIYMHGEGGESADGIACHIAGWLTAARDAELAETETVRISKASLAAIVYTSGTTGRPKGVMLSHLNVVSNLFAIMEALQIAEEDVFLSFLPLSHTLERTAGYYLPILAGATVVFARSASLLMEDLQIVRPTVLISVPRIYEKEYQKVREAVDAHWVRGKLLSLTVSVGWRQFAVSQHLARPLPLVARCLWRLLDGYVAAPVRGRFGSRLRAALAGGAPLAAFVARPFLALGIPLLQGYGTTESSPVIACNTPADNDPATVGRPLPRIETQIGADDELLVRGDNVMLGYWRRPEATARVLEPGGWLHTGDQAILENGRVRIKGRLKDIIVTSTGEKISPSDLEAAILNDAIFDQAVVLGEKRPYLIALLVVNNARWSKAAEERGLDPAAASGLNSAIAKSWAIERIQKAVRTFPSYATPRAVFLTAIPWTVQNGLITRTLKPIRAAIEAQYAKDIEALYAGHSLR